MVLGNFAVLEGCDGSGTTTQLELLSRRFAGSPLTFYATSEPTRGPVGELVRRLLKEPSVSGQTRNNSPRPEGRGIVGLQGMDIMRVHTPTNKTMPSPNALKGGVWTRRQNQEGIRPAEGKRVTPETLARLFAADRAEHLYGSGGIVERCSVRGELVVSDRYSLSSLVYQAIDCGEELPRILNESFPLPELLVYLDVESETAEKRIAGRPERQIFEYLEFQKKAREGYLKLLPVWETNGVKVLALDGSRPPEEVAEEVWRAVAEMPIVKRAI